MSNNAEGLFFQPKLGATSLPFSFYGMRNKAEFPSTKDNLKITDTLLIHEIRAMVPYTLRMIGGLIFYSLFIKINTFIAKLISDTYI